jgi:hypothetical protein
MSLFLPVFSYRSIDKTVFFGAARVWSARFAAAALAGEEAAIEGPAWA